MPASNQGQKLSEKIQSNLEEIELDIVTSSQYFKPNSGTTYIIEIDLDKYRIKPIETELFSDSKGNPVKRYELVITHMNNDKEQIWTVSKTVCLQIIEQLRKGFTTLKVTRNGLDRNTTYTIEGVQ